jgi:hypothetical protein
MLGHIRRVLVIFISISIVSIWSLSANAAPVLWTVNGHYYDVIDANLDWEAARTAAEASTFMGVPGRLAAITSAEENLFLTNTFGASRLHFHWIGGTQPAGSPEPGGGWSWVTGEPFGFSNWWPPAEPNNFSGIPGENEDGIVLDHGVTAHGKSWNDLPRTRIVHGYVVEFTIPPSTGQCDGLDACLHNTGSLGAGACIGDFACTENAGDVAKNACHGDRACLVNSGMVGEIACVGDDACAENHGDIAKAGCALPGACSANTGSVGEAACVGEEACAENDGDIGKLGCRGPSACSANAGSVGEAACVGEEACAENDGDIDKLSCRGLRACTPRRGAVGENACIGDLACSQSGPGAIGRGACHGERACLNNPGPIAAGVCNGPPVAGKGICER